MGADPESRLGRVRAEFARQAPTFDAHAVKADVKVEERFARALGEAGRGRILDVACGPGVVTAAVARSARSVVGIDAAEAMLERARKRAADAGLAEVAFQAGDAENLPFEDGAFDGVVTRLALHHFQNPDRAIREMFRVLRPGGRAVIVDVVASETSNAAAVHNAIEILRDPSHVRMLPPGEIDGLIAAAGFRNLAAETWDKDREFEEWMDIVNDPLRVAPLRTLTRALAARGEDAGIGLRLDADGRIVFFHRWRLVAADKA